MAESEARRWIRPLATALGAALAMAALETAQTWARSGLNDSGPLRYDQLPVLFGFTLRSWLVLVALAPLPIALARRCPPLQRPRHALFVHGAGIAGFVLLHVLLLAAVLLLFGIEADPLRMVIKLLTLYSALDLLVYLGLVAAVEALRLAHTAEAQASHAARLEASLGSARLQALRATLNPHFLFNAMNALATLALAGRGAEVAEGLERLAGLLRASLDERLGGEIPLSRELELAETYLAIERLRFGDRLRVERDVPNDTLTALVPSLILQPLLENAVRHGVGARAKSGRIALRARVVGDALRLEVEDDGVGYDAAVVDGVGLRLVRERLECLHPGAHTFTIAAGSGGGSLAALSLPWRRPTA